MDDAFYRWMRAALVNAGATDGELEFIGHCYVCLWTEVCVDVWARLGATD